MSFWRSLFYSLISGFFLSILFAFSYRFPVPFTGLIGPLGELSIGFWDTIKSVVGAWIFYGIFFGGIVVYLALNGALQFAIRRNAKSGSKKKLTVISIVLGFIPVLALTHLDFVIGPW